MKPHMELQFAGEIRFYECYVCGKLTIKQRIRKVGLLDENGKRSCPFYFFVKNPEFLARAVEQLVNGGEDG